MKKAKEHESGKIFPNQVFRFGARRVENSELAEVKIWKGRNEFPPFWPESQKFRTRRCEDLESLK